MPMINADDGCPIHVEVAGSDSAPALMLSNSLGTNLNMWDDQVDTWSKHFRVIRYDRRGHGRSGAPQGPYSMERFGRDVISVLDALDVKKTNWCGLSMGGMVGQWLGANAPTRMNRMILSNTACYYADKPFWNGRIKLLREKGLGAIVDPTIERWFTKDFRDSAPQTIADMSRMLLATPLEGYIGCCEAVRDMDFRASTPTITAPVMVIVGTKDPATLPEHGHEINKMIKGSKIVELDAAHLSNIEQPKAYTDAVLNFLTH